MTALIVSLSFLVAVEYALAGLFMVPRIGQRTDHRVFARGGQIAVALLAAGAVMSRSFAVINALQGDHVPYVFLDHVAPLLLQAIGGAALLALATTHFDVIMRPKELAAIEADRERLLVRLQALATRDELTGLLNRRAFDEEMAQHVAYGQRYGREGGVIFIDLDGFKEVNDSQGHAAGDRVLVRVAQVLTAVVRSTDVVARIGGDEFGVLLRDAGPVEVAGTAERIVREVARVEGIYASAGVASCIASEDVLHEADEAMYQAKRAGGNRYVIADRAA